MRIFYRSGGTLNGTWNEAFPLVWPEYLSPRELVESILRQGYRVVVMHPEGDVRDSGSFNVPLGTQAMCLIS